MKTVVIIGAGRGGTALLKLLMETKKMEVIGVSDIDPQAPGMLIAEENNIETQMNWKDLISPKIDIVIEATGSKDLIEEIKEVCHKDTTVISGTIASFIFQLIDEKESLIAYMKEHGTVQETILNSTHDGMIAINMHSEVTLFNDAAGKMADIDAKSAIGQKIGKVMPASQLPRILQTQKEETNQEQLLDNGRKILTTRVPLICGTEMIGALAVFRDITEIVQMAEEVTSLKSIQTMLEAIIHSSDDAISVVDEQGLGIMINPAYTRLTGLMPEDVIGKPATADIYEGESMHMHVLKTRKAVRGVQMRVGPKRKDVLVNVAPVIVDGILKGSVGVIHDTSEIKTLTDQLQRARQIIRTLEAKYTFDDIIGDSDEMKVAIEQAKLAATTPATILLRGESGTGKELFAHAIHNESERKYNKFIRVNCAAISETLLESELFGYEEGAFSGAKRGGKRGLFEEANKGSIFLDEIGELSGNMQAKLLRVLQEKEIVRVGGTKPIQIDVRVIAATNVNLEKGMNDNTFREDLYYRLNKMPIFIPPLRERKEDLPELCIHLIHKLNQDYGRAIYNISGEAHELIKKYDWPGNVRELENVLGRAMIYMTLNEHVIETKHFQHLPTIEKGTVESKATSHVLGSGTLSEQVENLEREIIINTLENCEWNKTAAAKTLGLSVRNLYYKMEKYNIEKNFTQ
ncbi:sigma 54-interacting transcriptional regulator [Alkalihalobacterium chitinilyticum]|uniref:Sigma 54-interacting transcriptional regulator n=1 Tax=Alkalihalobacterium chitinilyticum TaxID=2980103 RepID=A0ABT5VBY6_9BACI|nr:sigma 54-interacting transcriptional regulator [Alkalihalobacterium chitinilyticum]MDE5412227.1 sigma 54-interacting transcriptional regulator [Alkalihalobacterium chitinilyticum]